MIEMMTQGVAHPDYALTTVRVATGLFFAISGGHKLFVKQRHAGLVETLKADKVPAVGFMQWWVPGWEFTAGVALTVGLGSVLAATVLAVIMLVACCLEGAKRVAEYKPIDKLDKVDDWLYLPEVLYLILLAVTIVAGPGSISMDRLVWG